VLVKRRALINLHTQLENIPKEWLNVIEPKVFRGAFLPHWIWSGAVCKSYPVIYVDRKQIGALRFIAKIFYEFPDDWHVDLSCHYPGCVNPNHIRVRKFHPNHYSD
jgi:hypothetical protein